MSVLATRRERVVLELEDRFTTGMARAAASAALLNRELDSLSKDSIRTQRSLSDIDAGATRMTRNMDSGGRQIDRFSGRIRLLGEALAVLGPGLVPIGAVGIPAVTGLAQQLGFATVAAGTAVLAFQGVGDALAKVNKAGIDPTSANLKAADLAMRQLGPDAQALVNQLHDLQPAFRELRDAAAAGLLPGFGDSLRSLESALPRIEGVVSKIAGALGDIAADTGESLASDRWAPFLEFIGDEAPGALFDLADITGNVAHALAEMWMAFAPVNNDFSQWLVEATEDLDRWAEGLSQTQGFEDFVNYIRENGPQVADTFSAIADATLQIVQAASPLGGPVLQGVEAFAKAVSAIADSDLGTPLLAAVAALSLFNRGIKATEALSRFGGRLDVAGAKARRFGDNINKANLAKSAALLGGLAVAGSGAADSIGLTNTASLGLIGSAGGPLGVALGSAAGFTLDLAHANDELTDALDGAARAAESNSSAQIQAARDALGAQASQLATGNGFMDNFRRVSAFVAGQDDALLNASIKLDEAQQRLSRGTLNGLGTLLTQNLGGPAQQAAADLDGAAGAAGRLNSALDVLNGNLSQSQTMIQLRDSLRGLSDVVKQNPLGTTLSSGLDARGEQGDAVRSQLLGIIQLTLQAASGMKELDQIPFMRQQRANILQAARDLGLPLKAVEDLLNSFAIVNQTDVKPTVDPSGVVDGVDKATSALDGFMNRDYTLHFKAVLDGLTNPGKPGSGAGLLLQTVGRADGGEVPGQRFPYGDRTLVLAAPGEEIITNRNGEADRFRRDRASGRIPRYADGGTVQPFSSSVSNTYNTSSGLSSRDLRAIATLVANSRQLYGDVHVHGDGSFRRELQNDSRMAASDGISR